MKGYIVLISGESINYFMHKYLKMDNLDLYIGCDFAAGGYGNDDTVFVDGDSFHFTADIMTRFLDYILPMSTFRVTNIRLSNSEDVLVNYMKQNEFSGVIEIGYPGSWYKRYKLWTENNPKLKMDNCGSDFYKVPGMDQRKITVDYSNNETLQEEYHQLPHEAFINRISGFVQ